MAFNLQRVNRIQRRLTALEDDISESSEAAVVSGLKRISTELQKAVRGFQLDEDGNIASSEDNFALAGNMVSGLSPALNQIAEIGKSEVLGKLADVSDDLDNMLKAAGFQTEGSGLDRIDQNVIGTFLNLDLDRFNGGAEATTKVIQDQIFGLITGSNTFDQMVDAIKNSVENDNFVARHAKTWAMSAVISYEGQFMQTLIPPEEVGGFYYSGPSDEANRDFCLERAGRIFKKEKIANDVANNPIGNSSLRLPGGWNCRHVLVPVPIEDDRLTGNLAKEGADVPDQERVTA